MTADKPRRGFASDNHAGIHPDILQALIEANQDHAPAYGGDAYTAAAKAHFKRHFGPGSEAYLVFNGTAANVLSMAALTRPYHAIICAETAHLNIDECGAPEKFTGCRVLTVPAADGKLTPASIQRHMVGLGDCHRAQPRVVTVTQPTELGTVYTPEEIAALAAAVHGQGMLLHMDGARLPNAAASLGLGLGAITTEVGVDVLSFGGTKNGLAAGEAVVFCNPEWVADFAYIHKQGLQLASKMRFLSAQFNALLEGDLWLRIAHGENAMAQVLADQARHLPLVEVFQPVQANGVFAQVPPPYIARLQERVDYAFTVWDQAKGQMRWMTSFDTTQEDIAGFVESMDRALRD
ncbi:MAG: threonine aldolase [Candidatus Latescibacteria bacterium]|nr:threonine aldolase [Candidatus Latescibacterota bacterium]